MSLGLHNIHSRTQSELAERQLGCYSAEIVARFWAKVDRRGADDCWLWTASASGSRGVKHGQFALRRVGKQQRVVKAHRVAWELLRGPIPDGVNLCHNCPGGDNPLCCNPRHLFVGTQAENLADARRKGRLDERRPRNGKLTLADRLAIQAAEGGRGLANQLAARYGVSRMSISYIRRGRFVDAAHLEPVQPVAQDGDGVRQLHQQPGLSGQQLSR